VRLTNALVEFAHGKQARSLVSCDVSWSRFAAVALNDDHRTKRESDNQYVYSFTVLLS